MYMPRTFRVLTKSKEHKITCSQNISSSILSLDDDWLLDEIRSPPNKPSSTPVGGVRSGALAALPASLTLLPASLAPLPVSLGPTGGEGLLALDLRQHEELMRERQRVFEEQQRQQQASGLFFSIRPSSSEG